MGLSIQTKNCEYLPALICDTCKKPIKVGDLAIVTFPNRLGTFPISGIYHQGDCDPNTLVHNKDETDCSMTQNEYFLWLMWNSGFGKQVITEQKRLLIIEIPKPTEF